MIEFHPIDKQVFSSEEAMQYLGLTNRSSLDNLISAGRLTPLRIAKENRFAKSELDSMIERELGKERRLRGASADET